MMLSLQGLAAGPAADWVLANCVNLDGASLYCDYSPSLGQAWDDSQCDPNKSAATGVCTDTAGQAIPGVSPIIRVESSVSGGPLAGTQVQGTLQVATQVVPSVPPIQTPTQTPIQTPAPLPQSGACSQSLIKGFCDAYFLLGAVGVVLLIGMTRQ